MGKIADKLKGIINPDAINDNYDDDYVFDGEDNAEYGYDDYGQQGQQQQQGGYMNQNQNHSQQRQQHGQNQYPQQTNQNQGGGGGGYAVSSATAVEMKIMRPERYDSVRQIADHLLNRRTVFLNLESTTKEDARRIIDFMTGVVYSIGGDIRKGANNTFIIAPNNVGISEDQPGRQQDKNIYNNM